MKLLIVESPGKIKKLQSILPAEWRVAASVGHIRDLPQEGYGLEPPDFRPVYQITPEKKDVVARLKTLAAEADEVYLASDPDREGEAIAWHLKDVLGLSACKRVTYTAITKDDVEAGIAAPRDIDMALVHAQEARRALDRLVGYKVSGPLSRACSESRLSAGRVQSPAVRIVVDREQEIRSFVSTTHYGVELTFDRVENVSEGWNAVWLPREGWLDEDNPYVLDKAVADRVAAVRSLDVLAFEEKEAATAPPAPFTTSSLQQAAGNALKFTPKKTMELAQKLYEAGHITYMRTDSPNLSETAIAEIRAYADAQGLPLPPAPRTWKSKDGAQEAHEAIRPTHIDVEEAGENADEQALYALIRLRALASQLADAVFAVRVARLGADVDGRQAIFEARGRTLVHPGWKQVMAADAADDEDAEPSNSVPLLKEGATAVVQQGTVSTKKTKPKPRYKQTTLIREMERRGIGRPATYAAILDNIIAQKGYLREEKGWLVPTPRGEAIVAAMQPVFSFMNLDFTKRLEDALDDVAGGRTSYADCVGLAYDTLMAELATFREKTAVPCPACGNRDTFYHNVNPEKGWNYWKCKECNASFADDNGRPGSRKEKKEIPLSEFDCLACGSAKLRRITGTKNGAAYDFFKCSDDNCGATFNAIDGRPVPREEPTLSEFACKQCGKPLAVKPTRKGGIYFSCTGYPKCRQRYWAKDDNSPDYENPPK